MNKKVKNISLNSSTSKRCESQKNGINLNGLSHHFKHHNMGWMRVFFKIATNTANTGADHVFMNIKAEIQLWS